MGGAYVVVAEHDSFGLARGSWGVNERAALVGLLAGDDGIEGSVGLVASKLQELGPLWHAKKNKNTSIVLLVLSSFFLCTEVCALTVYRFGLFSFSSSLYWTMAFKCGSLSSICAQMWRRSVNPLVGFLHYKLLLLQLGKINTHIIIIIICLFCSAGPEICSACWSVSTCNSLSSYLKDFLQLFVVLHHDDISLGVFCYILACLRRVGGVDAHSKPTVRQRHVTQSAIGLFTSLYCSNRINIPWCWLRGLPFADMYLISEYRYCSFTSSRHRNKSLEMNQKH